MHGLAYPDPPLGDGVVRLRRWELGDLDCVEQASADPEIPEGTTVPRAFSPSEGRAFVRRQWSRLDRGVGLSLAIADVCDDRACGAIVLLHRVGQQAGALGLGYWIVPAERRRGLATRAVRLLAPFALARCARLEALVEPRNVASQRVVEAAGFEREGLLRAYLEFPTRRADAIVYSRLPGRDPIGGATGGARPARAADAGAIARLLTSLGYATDPATVAARLGSGACALVHEGARGIDGVVVLALLPVVHEAAPWCRISALVVDEAARGEGIGRGLVRAAEAYARAWGASRVELTSAHERTEAHAFWRACGYVEPSRYFRAAGDSFGT